MDKKTKDIIRWDVFAWPNNYGGFMVMKIRNTRPITVDWLHSSSYNFAFAIPRTVELKKLWKFFRNLPIPEWYTVRLWIF